MVDIRSVTSVAPTVTPNASPQNGEAWFSNSLARLGADPSPSKRYPISINGQEPSAWVANGRINLVYTNGAAHLAYTYCTTDPTVAANWAAPVDIIGGGAGSFAGTAAHSFVYIESATLYCFFVDLSTQNVRVATAALSDPTTWTTQAGTIIGPQGLGTNGNICVVKDGSTYRMFLECMHADTLPIEGTTNSWQTVMATSGTVMGSYTVQINPVTTLRPTANASVSGVQLFLEGTTWIAYYHGGAWGRVFPNDIYRATCTDLSVDSWTVDNGGYPIMRRAHRNEVDQACDPCVLQANGVTYLFYSGCNNRNSIFKQMVTVLKPMWHQWDGVAWKQVGAGVDASPPNTEAYLSYQWLPAAGPGGTSIQTKVGTWALDTTPLPAISYNSSNAQNDLIDIDIPPLPPGNYQIEVYYQKGSTGAILTVDYEDGANGFTVHPGTIDSYAASGSDYNKASRLLRVLGTETFRRRLRVKAATRNASSTGWKIGIHGILIRDDGFYPDLVVNGRFDEGTNFWGAQGTNVTWTAANNQLTIVRTGALDSQPNQLISGMTVGKQYKLTCDIATSSVNAAWGLNNTLAVGTGKTVTWTADATSKTLQFWPIAVATSVISNVSVREVPS